MGSRIVGGIVVSILARLRIVTISVTPIDIVSLDPPVVEGVVEPEVVIILSNLRL